MQAAFAATALLDEGALKELHGFALSCGSGPAWEEFRERAKGPEFIIILRDSRRSPLKGFVLVKSLLGEGDGCELRLLRAEPPVLPGKGPWPAELREGLLRLAGAVRSLEASVPLCLQVGGDPSGFPQMFEPRAADGAAKGVLEVSVSGLKPAFQEIYKDGFTRGLTGLLAR
ncbi:MAG: hypothetical protein HY928_16855 [Elusimicrobia bacterium]|nr:hypothetical protein [Elusimicrobiota bacterium]